MPVLLVLGLAALSLLIFACGRIAMTKPELALTESIVENNSQRAPLQMKLAEIFNNTLGVRVSRPPMSCEHVLI